MPPQEQVYFKVAEMTLLYLLDPGVEVPYPRLLLCVSLYIIFMIYVFYFQIRQVIIPSEDCASVKQAVME